MRRNQEPHPDDEIDIKLLECDSSAAALGQPLKHKLRFSMLRKKLALALFAIALPGCGNSGTVSGTELLSMGWCVMTKGTGSTCPPDVPLKPVTPEEQAKWNHFTDEEIAKASWDWANSMRKTRYITDRPVPLHLGPFTFMIPFNYLSAKDGPVPESTFTDGVRFGDERSGPIKFFLWDFSGLTPRRDHPRTHNDKFVHYNFGVDPSPFLKAGLGGPAAENTEPIPDFHELGLQGFLPLNKNEKNLTVQEKELLRNKRIVTWVGKSSHGGEIVFFCSNSSCNGYGTHPVGGYDYKLSLDINDFPRWREVEAGVHGKLMSWLVTKPAEVPSATKNSKP